MLLPWVSLLIACAFKQVVHLGKNSMETTLCPFQCNPCGGLGYFICSVISDTKFDHFFTVKTCCSTFVIKLVLCHIAIVFIISKSWDHLKCHARLDKQSVHSTLGHIDEQKAANYGCQ